jgi:hypothetical protein
MSHALAWVYGEVTTPTVLRCPVACQNSFIAADLAFRAGYAALWYSLIRPPRTCLRSILAVTSTAWPGCPSGGWDAGRLSLQELPPGR